MSTFRMLLADNHPVFRMGVRTLITSHQSWEVCGEAADGREAVTKCLQLKPDFSSWIFACHT
jgi:two-component system, NarL family, nitrate/nitrite response regulator NarL